MMDFDRTKEVRLGALEPGTEFECADVKYRLLYSNDCRAYVQILTGRRAAIKRRVGDKEEVLAEFDAPGQKVNIAPGALVHVVRLPNEIPAEEKIMAKEERKARGRGKEPAEEMKKLLNPSKKIGKVVKWFLDEGPQTIPAMMSKFQITHGCSLSYLFVLNRDYGLGYTVEKDVATLILPKNVTNPFKGEAQTEDLDDLGIPSDLSDLGIPPAKGESSANAKISNSKKVQATSSGPVSKDAKPEKRNRVTRKSVRKNGRKNRKSR